MNTRSVRFRSVAGATAALVLLLAIAGLVIFALVRTEIRTSFDNTLLEQATDRASLLDDGAEPSSLTATFGDEEIVAVVGVDGEVIASGGVIEPQELSTIPLGLSNADITILEVEEYGNDPSAAHQESLRLASVEASNGQRLIVGNEGEETRRTITTVGTVLLAATTITALLAAGVAWFVIGRSLLPVHRIRDDLDGIVHASSGMRVRRPNTGDEIDELAETMNEVLDRLDAQSLVRQRFVSDASHELKSPLANARVRIETTPTALDEAGERELRSGVIAELDRMQALVDDLLYLARTDEATPVHPVRFDLDDVIFDEAERATTRTSRAVDAGGVQPASVIGDRNEVARAVRNLIENASRHASSRVTLSVEFEGGSVLLVVDDDGDGVPEVDREVIFERFTRRSSDRARVDGGTGLGLSIVAGIAERNGGSVTVDEAPTGGARFVLRLPMP